MMPDPHTRIIRLRERVAALRGQHKNAEVAEHELKMEVTRQLNRENRQDKKRRVA